MRSPRRQIISTALLLLGVGATPSEGTSQVEVLDWNEFVPCEGCGLDLARVLRLGDREGPGQVIGIAPGVVVSPDYGIAVYERTSDRPVQIFDPEGAFVRTLGSAGRGPGELATVTSVNFTSRGEVLVSDYSRKAHMLFNRRGRLVREVSAHDEVIGHTRLVAGDTLALIAANDRRPPTVGIPLHIVDLRSGTAIGHFGERTGEPWQLGAGYLSDVLVLEESGPIADGTVWLARSAGLPVFEEWALDGSLRRALGGDLDWLWQYPDNREREGPATALQAFAVDDGGRLWMLTTVADPDWESVKAGGAEPGVPGGQRDQYRDARLDVFSIPERRHVGSFTWDAPLSVALTQARGNVYVAAVVVASRGEVQLQLYALPQ